jgi:selenocysteine lyase/cysteine desulfurase
MSTTAVEPPAASFDAGIYRSLTPGVASVLHLNAASAALPSRGVVAVVKAQLDLEAEIGPQAATARAQDGLVTARRRAATLLDCRPDQIAFGDSSARLWSLAFHALRLPKRGRILVSRGEWGGNLLAIAAASRDLGIMVETIPTDDAGTIDLAYLQTRIDDDVRLIAVTAVSSASGICQPVAAIGALARPRGCLYIVDAAQAIGRFPFSLDRIGADVVTAPARKWLRGPRGQALAAFSDAALSDLAMPPLLDLAGVVWSEAGSASPRSDARRFETYEYSMAGRLGFGAALGELLDAGPAAISDAINDGIRSLRTALGGCEGVTVQEPIDTDPAFLTLNCGSLHPPDLARALSLEGIAVASVGRAYAPAELDARHLAAVLRVAPHAYGRADEIARFANVLERVVPILRESRHAAASAV